MKEFWSTRNEDYMIFLILTLVLLLWNIPNATENDEIMNMINEGCEYHIFKDFQDLKNVINKNVNPEITADEVEHILLKMAEKEYVWFKKDTTQEYTILLFCISRILSTFESKKTDVFLKKLYKTGNSRLMKMTLDYMILKSDEWFQCSKNIIDSMDIKYTSSFRLSFTRKLIKKMETKNAAMDSIEYILYMNLLNNNDFGEILALDRVLATNNNTYAKSNQRIEILKKIDNKLMKKKLNIREERKKKDPNFGLYADEEIAYNTYLKLKKEKDLKNYSPPILSSK